MSNMKEVISVVAEYYRCCIQCGFPEERAFMISMYLMTKIIENSGKEDFTS